MKRKRSRQPTPRHSQPPSGEKLLRVIGGQLRGRSFRYNGDPGLRPMKDRVREAVFNLVGPAVKGMAVIDLFAGTGAMAFEALSRGAGRALLIERRFPNVKTITENSQSLGLASQVDIRAGDALATELPSPGKDPWLVFCCPPYELYQSKTAELLSLIARCCLEAPRGSLVVVEADRRFDWQQLPDADRWDVRTYSPAVIGVFEPDR